MSTTGRVTLRVLVPAESAAAWIAAIDAAIAACKRLNATDEPPADEPVPFVLDEHGRRP